MLATTIAFGSLRRLLTGAAPKIVCLNPTRSISNVEDPIVMTNDGSTFVCWHPEKLYPYEFTKPMPVAAPKPPQVLKTDNCSAVMKRQKELDMINDLAKMTQTTKHRWFPRASKYKKKQKIPLDREYL